MLYITKPRRIYFFTIILCVVGVLLPGGVSAETQGSPDASIEWTVTGAWDSRYVLQGRDYLEAGGLGSVDLYTHFKGIDLGVWSAFGDDGDYEEYDFYVGYGDQIQGIDWYVSYTHIQYASSESNDDELSIELGYALTDALYFGIESTYSFEAEGSFLELNLGYTFEEIFEGFSLTPSALLGFDFGYSSAAFDGINNLQFKLDGSYQITDTISLGAYVAHSFALKDLDREGLGDLGWGGISLSYAY